jgi:sodium transport system ATP-binding protein
MIRVDDLHKSFGGRAVLRGVTFEAPDGQITGLLGPNGAGKTTTLRAICGLLAPDRGRVLVDDVDPALSPVDARRRLGMLGEGAGLYGRLTARENVAYFGRLHGLDAARVAERIRLLSPPLGLDAIAARRAARLSQGERLKVSLARALVHAPRNIVLDEPTNGLDVAAVRSLRQLLLDLRREGLCILFSSHVMQEVRALCDRVVILSRGSVAAAGSPDDLARRSGRTDLEDLLVEVS